MPLKHGPASVDVLVVAPFSSDAWVLLAAVAGICLFAFLYALATLYRDQTALHDLKVRVHDLRREYAERLAQQHADEIIEALPAPASRMPLQTTSDQRKAA